MDRSYSFPKQAKHFYCFVEDAEIKVHPGYKAAKAGDPEEALKLIDDLAKEFIYQLKVAFPQYLNYVSPYAEEATGDNAIPLLLSMACAQVLGGENEADIVQLQKVFHTGADPME